MLKRHSKLFKNLLFISDLIVLSGVWIIAYYLRFYSNLIPIPYGDIPHFGQYLLLIIPILIIWGVIFNALNLYRPRRLSTHLSEVMDIAKACTLATVVLIALTYFYKKTEFSRIVFLSFWLLSIVALSLSRGIFRQWLGFLRSRGHNLRHVIIVGDGVLAREVITRLTGHPEFGLNIIGFLSGKQEKVGRKIYGKEIIGTYGDIENILKEKEIDQVFIAISFPEINCLEGIFKSIGNYPVNIKLIPDIHHFLPFCGYVEELEGLAVLGIQDSPLYGWNIVMKRLLDVIVASLAILIASPLFIIIAITIKLTSPGPIFYRQKRAGLDGNVFGMLKFRTMHIDAEKETGPVWAKENDPRRTIVGAFLRKTSLDELPQFFNVLKGDMSVVGPRPERPEFIEKFTEDIPRYMLRHKMKAGITGWAQVNGWRGNTDLKKRINHDLYYIENWSVWLDIKIMWFTIWRGLIHKHAY